MVGTTSAATPHFRIVPPAEYEQIGRPKRKSRSCSVAQPLEPSAVGKLIADEINSQDEFNDVEPSVTKWLKKSLLEVGDDNDLKRRVKALLGSPNYLEQLSNSTWDSLRRFCQEQALSLGFDMEENLCLSYFDSEKEDLLEVVGKCLDEIFPDSAFGMPQRTDARNDSLPRYVVVPDERALQKRTTVWCDLTPFRFDVRQDHVLHSSCKFSTNEEKSLLWNEKAYIHALRLVALAVNEQFQSDVERLCKEAHGEMRRSPIKAFERMKNKCTSEGAFPRSAENLDVNRNCSTFDTVEGLLSFIRALQAHPQFGSQPIRFENAFTDDDDTAKDHFYIRTVKINWLYSLGMTYKEFLNSSDSDLWKHYYDYQTVNECEIKDPEEPWQIWREQIAHAMKYLSSDALANEQVQIIVETRAFLRPYLDTHLKTHLLRKIGKGLSQTELYHEFSAQDFSVSSKSYDQVQDEALSSVEKFLEENPTDINRRDAEDGMSKLSHAAMNGHFKAVRRLLKNPQINVNLTRKDTGATPMFLASQHGHVKVVQALLEHRSLRVNQSRTDIGEASPLHIAAQNGHDEVVELLLTSPAIKVNQAMTVGKRTPLFVASYYGHERVVDSLMRHPKIRINQATDDGATPLYIAAQEGHEDIVQKFLERKDVLINAATKDEGRTALSIACQQGHIGVVKKLLVHPKIDVNKATITGATPLFMASQEGKDEVVKLLVAHASIKVQKARKSDKATPLQISQSMNHEHVVDILEAKANAGEGKENCTIM